MNKNGDSWDDVASFMEGRSVTFGPYLSYWFDKTPRRALHYASYYKFAAKLIGSGKRVLDLGCSEGLGTWMLARECGFARGVDRDGRAIAVAERNWQDESVDFMNTDLYGLVPESYDAVVSLDVVEHILRENTAAFFRTVVAHLGHDGIAVIGTPSLEGQRYASPVSRAGHVNVYSYEDLEEEMRRYFHHVFVFCGNDEVVHTGFPRMAHYLVAVGCRKRGESRKDEGE